MAPLTGIAFAINWLIGKLNLKIRVVKTTRMTTNFANTEHTMSKPCRFNYSIYFLAKLANSFALAGSQPLLTANCLIASSVALNPCFFRSEKIRFAMSLSHG